MKQRLVDANALKEAMLTIINGPSAIAMAIKKIESAPTVETTDDVLAKWDSQYRLEPWMGEWHASHFAYRTMKETVAKGKTPLEAVTRLEAALRA